MDNLTYIPTREELHVGFECQILDAAGNWIDNTIQSLYELQLMESRINLETIRVEKLDTLQIDSLGLFTRPFDEDASKICISKELNGELIGSMQIDENPNGTDVTLLNCALVVKNKSEFKKLIVQTKLLQ